MKNFRNALFVALAATMAFGPLSAGCKSGAENEQEDVQQAKDKLKEEQADAAKED